MASSQVDSHKVHRLGEILWGGFSVTRSRHACSSSYIWAQGPPDHILSLLFRAPVRALSTLLYSWPDIFPSTPYVSGRRQFAVDSSWSPACWSSDVFTRLQRSHRHISTLQLFLGPLCAVITGRAVLSITAARWLLDRTWCSPKSVVLDDHYREPSNCRLFQYSLLFGRLLSRPLAEQHRVRTWRFKRPRRSRATFARFMKGRRVES